MNINARVADIILAKKGMTRTALAERPVSPGRR